MTTIISFCFGNHTFKCFESKVRALEYLDELWDEEFQTRLLNLEMVEVAGIDTILREDGSTAYFLKRIGDAICLLPNAKITGAEASGASPCWVDSEESK